MPWGDWQFWVVSVVTVIGLGIVLRPLLPSRRNDFGCSSCPDGEKPPQRRRAKLTIDGARPRTNKKK